MSRRIAVAAVASLLVAYAALWMGQGRAPVARAGEVNAGEAVVKAVAPPGPSFGPMAYLSGVSTGTRLQYAMAFESSYQQHGQAFSLSGRGDLRWTVVSRGPRGARLKGELLGLQLTGGQGSRVRGADELRRAGQRPFYVDVQSDGSIEGILTEPDAMPSLIAIRRTLAAAFQVTERSGVKSHWRAHERDHAGQVVVRYRRVGEDELEKEKERYERIREGDQLISAAGVAEVKAHAHLTLQHQRAIREYEGSEQTTIRFMQLPIASRSELSLKLREQTQVTPPPDADASYVFVPLYGEPQRGAENGVAEPSHRSLTTLLTELGRAADADSFPWELVEELAGLLAHDPDAIATVVAQLSTEELDPGIQQRLLTALAEADTEAAQLGLLDVARDGALASTRASAMAHVSLSEQPKPATIARLREILDAEGADPTAVHAAALAYGASARHGAASADASTHTAAQDAVAHMIQSLFDATSPDERQMWIGALGNSGAADAFAPLSTLARADEPEDRMGALAALRLVAHPETDGLLQDALVHDQDLQARRQALRSLEYRPFTSELAQSLERALSQEASDAVRKDILSLLYKNAAEVSRAADLLRQAAQMDGSAQVREYAAALLARAGQG